MQCEWKECEENFNSIDDFKRHLEIHTENNLTCFWKGCQRFGESQTNKYAFQAHMRKHTGDRPFKCKKCDKSYTRADALAKHHKNHKIAAKELEELENKILYLEHKLSIKQLEFETTEFNKRLCKLRLNEASKLFIELCKKKLKNRIDMGKVSYDSFWESFFEE